MSYKNYCNLMLSGSLAPLLKERGWGEVKQKDSD